MKELKYNKELIAYAHSFISFVFPKIKGIKEIILFGSVAREEAEKESDIDLFFDVNEKDENQIKEIIKTELKKYYKSKIAETWLLKGIKNPIKIEVGDLNKWKLKRSIISQGITLFGEHKELPENLKKYFYFNIEPINNISKRNRIIRKLFGRKENNYETIGIIKQDNGKKLTPTSFFCPQENLNNIIELLKKEKINYFFFEFWTDAIV